jgi:hypothetical protein
MYSMKFVVSKDDALEVARDALIKSCDSPYKYWIYVNRKTKIVSISRESGTELPRVEVPSWTLRSSYDIPKGVLRVIGLSSVVYDQTKRRHILKRTAILSELNGRMAPVADKLSIWIFIALYGNVY